jgi:diaminohydroxyphosphoribosylaminopyrimidine deaminase/5-amino-6-(5-phosphoribosylamino)uracil reductase
MTLDGKVATSTGDSKWISGDDSRARAHRWRAELDAVAVGSGTVAADDPLLTARVEAVPRQPIRVVFDTEARLPVDSQLVRSVDQAPLMVICGRAASRRSTEALAAAGAEVVVVSGENESARARAALDELGSRGVQSLLLEGGPHLVGAFLDAGEIDVVHAFVAPILAGGRNAKPAVEGEGVELIGDAPRAVWSDVERIGDDFLITARFREW